MEMHVFASSLLPDWPGYMGLYKGEHLVMRSEWNIPFDCFAENIVKFGKHVNFKGRTYAQLNSYIFASS